MSVVSAGGRRGPSLKERGPPMPRGDFRVKPQRRGYSHSDVGEPFIPRFSAIASEGVKYGMPPEEWEETTTVLTGVTNDSYTVEEKKVYDPPIGRVVSRRCSRMMWMFVAVVISIVAVVSAPLMCALPLLTPYLQYDYPSAVCDVDCQGLLLLVAVKTVLLIVALWALYWRRAAADMPRLYLPRAALSLFVLFILFAFWLFYTVRILLEKTSTYTYVVRCPSFTTEDTPPRWGRISQGTRGNESEKELGLFQKERRELQIELQVERKRDNGKNIYLNVKVQVTYSLSLLDALLYTHYISVIVLELRKMRSEYIVTIVRDPDGESHTMNLGIVSLQEAAIQVLRLQETTFTSFNASFDKARFGTHNRPTNASAGFKMYDIEGIGGGRETLSEGNARALLKAASRRRMAGHGEMLQEELDWERRIKKRKYRLIAMTEDAFAHVQGVVDGQQNIKHNTLGEPMDSMTAAQSVFTMVMRPLNKYLKLTRRSHKHPGEMVTKHIERCLSMKLNHRTFLERYFSERYPPKDLMEESKWSIISDDPASTDIQHGTTFLLRSHNREDDAGVQLLCTVSSLPFYNLTEQPRSAISKFTLRMNNESSV